VNVDTINHYCAASVIFLSKNSISVFAATLVNRSFYSVSTSFATTNFQCFVTCTIHKALAKCQKPRDEQHRQHFAAELFFVVVQPYTYCLPPFLINYAASSDANAPPQLLRTYLDLMYLFGYFGDCFVEFSPQIPLDRHQCYRNIDQIYILIIYI